MSRIKITGPGGLVIYDGEGALEWNPHGSGPGLPAAVLRAEVPGGGACLDMTEVCRAFPYRVSDYTDTQEVISRPFTTGVPGPSHTEVELDIPEALASHLRGELFRHLVRVNPREGWRLYARALFSEPDPVVAETGEALRRVGEAAEEASWSLRALHHFSEEEALDLYQRCVLGEEEVREQSGPPADVADMMTDDAGQILPDWRARYAAHEEAIRSTRALFPRDPYDYGRIHPSGPSRWTPPEDPDEEVPSCPA